jgi:hypothetical protein
MTVCQTTWHPVWRPPLDPNRTLSLRGGNWSSCPQSDLQGRDKFPPSQSRRAAPARPAVGGGRIFNRFSGPPSEELHERHDASDFATKIQDEIAAAAN